MDNTLGGKSPPRSGKRPPRGRRAKSQCHIDPDVGQPEGTAHQKSLFVDNSMEVQSFAEVHLDREVNDEMWMEEESPSTYLESEEKVGRVHVFH